MAPIKKPTDLFDVVAPKPVPAKPMGVAPVDAPQLDAPTMDMSSLFTAKPTPPPQMDAAIASRPTGTMDNMGGWRKAGLLASIFAGEAAKPGSMQPLLGQMRNQNEAQRQYDANKPVMQQEANVERDQRNLQTESTRSQIQSRLHQQQQEQANKKATLISQYQAELQGGKVPAQQLKYKYGRLAQVQNIPVAPEEFDQEARNVQPVGPAFSVVKGEGGRPEGLQDRTGKVYTPDAIPQDAEAQAMWTAAQKGHQQVRSEKKEDQAAALEAGVARMGAMANNRVVQIIDPNAPGNVVYQRAGNAIGASAPAGIGFQTAKATSKDAAVGEIGKTGRAFDTAEQHLQTLEKAGKALKNGDIQSLNAIANNFGLATGKDAPAAYNAVQQVIAGEINKAISSSGTPAEGEMKLVRSLTDSSLSDQQRAAVVASLRELMKGKKAAMASQVQRGMSGLKGAAPQVGATKKFANGSTGVWDGQGWVAQ